MRDFDLVSTASARWNGSAFGSLQHLHHLQSIKIHNSSLKILEQGPKMLHFFPPQIMKLSLSLPSLLEDWLLIRYSNVDDTRSAVLNPDGSPMKLDLGTLFPDLEELDIRASKPYHPRLRSMKNTETKSQIQAEVNKERAGVRALVFFYSHLPSKKLKNLHMPIVYTRPEDLEVMAQREVMNPSSSSSSSACIYDIFTKLPSTLETLVISMTRDPEAHARRAEHRHLLFAFLPPDMFAELPRSLISFSFTATSLSVVTAHKPRFLAPISEMKSLTFISLNLGHHFHSSTELFLPLSPSPSLTLSGRDLTIPCVISAMKLVIEFESLLPLNFFHYLPRTLEELAIELVETPFARGPGAMTIGSQLPTKLKSFKFSTTCHTGEPIYPIFGLDHMPSELVELHWGDACRISNEQIRALPSSLEILRLDLSSLAFEDHPTNCKCGHYEVDDDDDQYNGISYPRTPHADETFLERRLSDGASLHLPPALNTLELRHSSFGDLFFVNLPTSITDLSVVTDKPLESPLLFLSSAIHSLFIDAHLLSLHALESLPSTLRSLHLIEPISSPHFDKAKMKLSIDHYTFTDEFMAMIPSTVTDLNITGARSLSDEAEWPSSLTKLTLSSSCFLTDLSLTRFPKSLTQLHVQRMVITPHACRSRAEIIRDAPPFLPAHTLPWMTLKNRNVDFSSLP